MEFHSIIIQINFYKNDDNNITVVVSMDGRVCSRDISATCTAFFKLWCATIYIRTTCVYKDNYLLINFVSKLVMQLVVSTIR